jgi:thiamine biosynthesis lipoprotein
MLKILSQQKRALGTEVVMTLIGSDELEVKSLMAELWILVDNFEANFSRFLSTSELTRVNEATGKKTAVSEEFICLLNVCKTAFKQTKGVFNPLVLPVLQRVGYKNSLEPNIQKTDAPDYSSRKIYDFNEVQFGEDWLLLPENSALDFGGCGKGFLADKLANITDNNLEITGYWFSLGGDIVASGLDEKRLPWVIAIQGADIPDNNIAEATVRSKRLAIATSGTIKRRGKNWHHLIDSEVGAPAKTDILLATVCHSSATQADILASCAVIIGVDQAKLMLKGNGVTDFLLQSENNNIFEGSLIRGYS